jgi:antitoxin ParD1/3/4
LADRNVVLTEHQEKVIESLLRSGRYQDASDVVREALRLLERREAEDAARLEGLRQAAQKGIEAIESGEYRSFASFDELERHLMDTTEAVISRVAKR